VKWLSILSTIIIECHSTKTAQVNCGLGGFYSVTTIHLKLKSNMKSQNKKHRNDHWLGQFFHWFIQLYKQSYVALMDFVFATDFYYGLLSSSVDRRHVIHVAIRQQHCDPGHDNMIGWPLSFCCWAIRSDSLTTPLRRPRTEFRTNSVPVTGGRMQTSPHGRWAPLVRQIPYETLSSPSGVSTITLQAVPTWRSADITWTIAAKVRITANDVILSVEVTITCWYEQQRI